MAWRYQVDFPPVNSLSFDRTENSEPGRFDQHIPEYMPHTLRSANIAVHQLCVLRMEEKTEGSHLRSRFRVLKGAVLRYFNLSMAQSIRERYGRNLAPDVCRHKVMDAELMQWRLGRRYEYGGREIHRYLAIVSCDCAQCLVPFG